MPATMAVVEPEADGGNVAVGGGTVGKKAAGKDADRGASQMGGQRDVGGGERYVLRGEQRHHGEALDATARQGEEGEEPGEADDRRVQDAQGRAFARTFGDRARLGVGDDLPFAPQK